MGIRLDGTHAVSAPNTDNHEADTCDQGDGAQDRRNGHCICFLVGELNRTHVCVFLLMRETDPACGKTNDAEDDEKNSNNSCCLHKALLPIY